MGMGLDGAASDMMEMVECFRHILVLFWLASTCLWDVFCDLTLDDWMDGTLCLRCVLVQCITGWPCIRGMLSYPLTLGVGNREWTGWDRMS